MRRSVASGHVHLADNGPLRAFLGIAPRQRLAREKACDRMNLEEGEALRLSLQEGVGIVVHPMLAVVEELPHHHHLLSVPSDLAQIGVVETRGSALWNYLGDETVGLVRASLLGDVEMDVLVIGRAEVAIDRLLRAGFGIAREE